MKKLRAKLLFGRESERGSSLVEMALVCAFLYLPMIIGIFEISLAMYSYTFVSNAARLATRYASVRGVQSCTIASSFVDCNLSPSTGQNPTSTNGNTNLTTYVRGLAFPGISTSRLTVNTTWWSQDITTPVAGAFSTTAWDSQCTTTDLLSRVCNTPGNAVRVTVTYAFPLSIPFWRSLTLNLSSTSQMMINE